MEDVIEIDLRKYIRATLRNIIWILIFAVAAGGVMWVTASREPDAYASTALVAVLTPQYNLNFDPRFQTVQNTMTNYPAYIELAKSDDVVAMLFASINPKPADGTSVDALQGMLSAKPGTDPSLIKLTVTSRDAKTSALVANAWATVLISRIQLVYGGQGVDQVELFTDELEKGKEQLDKAEADLVKYQGQNDMGVLNNQLNSALQSQSEYLAKKRNIDYLRQDIQALLEQIKQRGDASSADLASQLNLFYVQMRVFNTQPSAPLATSINQADGSNNSLGQSLSPSNSTQLQVNASDLIAQTSTAEQIAILNNLDAILGKQAQDVDAQISGLTPMIKDLQGQIEGARATLDSLTQASDVAKETYTTLARKLDEVKISVQDTNNGAGLAAKAIESNIPLPRQTFRNAVATALAAGIIGILIVIIITWYRERTVGPVIKEPETAG